MDRRPLATMPSRAEKRTPKSIAWTASEWRLYSEAALSRGRSDVGPFIRELARIGLSFIEAQEAMGHMTSPQMLPGNTVHNIAGNSDVLPRGRASR